MPLQTSSSIYSVDRSSIPYETVVSILMVLLYYLIIPYKRDLILATIMICAQAQSACKTKMILNPATMSLDIVVWTM